MRTCATRVHIYVDENHIDDEVAGYYFQPEHEIDTWLVNNFRVANLPLDETIQRLTKVETQSKPSKLQPARMG